MIKIQVPATSANLGSGFDTLGIALSVYNTFYFEEIESGLEIIGSLDNEKNTDNLVYQSMQQTFKKCNYKPKGIRITIESSIPISRGLGSSSACIVGGIMGANSLMESLLSKQEMVDVATEIEGHPDNVAPALLGGCVCVLQDNNQLYYNSISVADDLRFVALIPDLTLSTKASREVLPQTLSFNDAISSISRVALLVSALSNKNYALLKPALKDTIHQPYRSSLIKDFDLIINQAYQYNALGAYLSGAGSTIMAITSKDNRQFKKSMAHYLKDSAYSWRVVDLSVDQSGAKQL